MKKLSLKSLKVVRLSDKEKSNISGGSGNCQYNSSSCGTTSTWPVNCNSTMNKAC